MIELQRPEILIFLLLSLYPLRNIFRTETYGKMISLSRFAAVILLVFAAAGPQMQMDQQRNQVAELTVLEDRSNSMTVMDELNLELDGVRVQRKTVASGNTTQVANNIAARIEEDRAYLVNSDFQGEGWRIVEETAKKKNATLFAMKTETEEENAVKIEGPENTVPGAETDFKVDVTGTEEDVPVTLYLDGEPVASGEDELEISRVFDEEGRHTMRAEIGTDDKYSFNNEYFKTFSVNAKPEILVLGNRGTLEDQMDTYFEVENVQEVPDDLEEYYSVVAKKGFEDEKLSDFVTEGNGLVYTGDYGSSNLLPVRPTVDGDQNKDSRVVVAIDISSSQSSSIPETQQMAYSLAEYLPGNVKMGVVAYSENAYSIMEPSTLAYNRDEIKERISELETEVLSYHHRGLNGASQMAKGEGNIIMMTDGRFSTGAELTSSQVRQLTLDEASAVDANLLMVGVGTSVNAPFLRNVATEGSGDFIRTSDLGAVSLRLDAGGGAGSVSSASVWDSNHFITKDLVLNSRPALYDGVNAKPGARTLVGSESGDPVLTTWRYGLGRVAAFSADNTDLEAVMAEDPALGIRTINWASGDPQKKLDDWIKVNDEGEEIAIESSTPRENFTRKGEDEYVIQIENPERGFSESQGVTYAQNTDTEYIEIGYSESMNKTVTNTGGEVFLSEKDSQLRDQVLEYSNETVSRNVLLSPYILAVSMIILLAEIGFRKLRGNR